MASLKQITVGTTSYDIIPDAITDSSANYKASCPTISSNTTVEVASNKTTIINSSSTATQYPSAKAVYTAIQNASKAGSYSTYISYTETKTTSSPNYPSLIATGGMFKTSYLKGLTILNGTVLDSVNNNGGSIATVYNQTSYATISNFINSGSIYNMQLGYQNVQGKILVLHTMSGSIGDASIPTTTNTSGGTNGIYGNGTLYMACTNATTGGAQKVAQRAFSGSIINKAGLSATNRGGTINLIKNDKYALIRTIENTGSINTFTTTGTIFNMSISSSGAIGTTVTSSDTEFDQGLGYFHLNGGAVRAMLPATSTNNFWLLHANQNLSDSTWRLINNGKIQPWCEVSAIATLISLLNAQTGILYKYTGSTTTYNGVTYTNGNFYRYEA